MTRDSVSRKCVARRLVTAALLLFVVAGSSRMGTASGQDQKVQVPQTPKQAALIDLTGYWVSIVDEDWRWRMLTPQKGDYASIPLNAEGKRLADTWDPVKDEREGNECLAYGAGNIMRIPGRLHITWQNDNTLRMDIDSGKVSVGIEVANKLVVALGMRLSELVRKAEWLDNSFAEIA